MHRGEETVILYILVSGNVFILSNFVILYLETREIFPDKHWTHFSKSLKVSNMKANIKFYIQFDTLPKPYASPVGVNRKFFIGKQFCQIKSCQSKTFLWSSSLGKLVLTSVGWRLTGCQSRKWRIAAKIRPSSFRA